MRDERRHRAFALAARPGTWYNLAKVRDAHVFDDPGKQRPLPRPGGACSGYLLESDSGETKLLLDAGTGSLARLQEALRVEELTAVVVSHLPL